MTQPLGPPGLFPPSLSALVLAGVAWLLTAPIAPAQEWTFLDGPAHAGRMSAYDWVRGRLVALGPDGDTWEYADGELLHRQVLGASPPPRSRAAMVYDRARGHVLLYGGAGVAGGTVDDTWFWDGVRWTEQVGGPRPPARADTGIAYDLVRRRVVLYGGQVLPGQRTDTWEHDGAQWIQRTPATQPGPNSPRMTYDLGRLRVVMVTHAGIVNTPVTTWEWDGVDWSQRATSGPPANGNESLAYDFARHRVVMFGGVGIQGQVWEWDGVGWQPSQVPTAPSRIDPAVYFDPTTSRVAILGGADFRMSGFTVMRGSDRLDAYEWDGGTWSAVHGDLRPGSRYGHVLCAQPGGGAVLFGGFYQQAPGDDTWTWNGNTWSPRSPANRPGPRSAAGAAFDVARQETLVFGGGLLGNYLADLWAWDGTDWTLRDAGSGPAGRIEPALSHDVARDETVLFGGFTGSFGQPSVPRGDTWEWDGTAWAQRTPVLAPSPRAGSALAYDSVRQRTVLFGGRNGATAQDQFADTWEWDGTNWQQLQPPTSPPALLQPSMHFEAATGAMLLVGTSVGGGAFDTQLWRYANGTWTQRSAVANYVLGSPTAWDAERQRIVGCKGGVLAEWAETPASATPFGVGCGAPVPTLGVRTRARLGDDSFGLEVSGTGLQPALIALALGQGNAPIGGGCAILLAAPITAVATMTNGVGRAEVGFPLPVAPWLRGVALYGQAAVLDPAAPLGVSLTVGLEVRLGD